MEIRKLNTLRGIAAIIVLVSHYSNRTNLWGNLFGGGGGQFGVMIFFILSGFLISYLYIKNEFNKKEIIRYITSRIARVLPLFLIVVFLSYAFFAGYQPLYFYKIENSAVLASHLLLLTGDRVLWTIPSEIHFYLLFPFIWFSYKEKFFHIFIFLLLYIIIFLGTPIFEGTIFSLPFKIKTVQSLPYFLMGVVLGGYYNDINSLITKKSNFSILLFFIGILCLYPSIYSMINDKFHHMWRDFGVYFQVSGLFAIYLFLTPDNSKWICNNVGDYLGKISYSVYLLHLPLLLLLQNEFSKYPAFYLPIFIGLVISFSHYTFKYVELPAQSFIKSQMLK